VIAQNDLEIHVLEHDVNGHMLVDCLLGAFCLPELDEREGGTLVEVVHTLDLPVYLQILSQLSLFEVLSQTPHEYLPHLQSTPQQALQSVTFTRRQVH
jgi:hypothetical protein